MDNRFIIIMLVIVIGFFGIFTFTKREKAAQNGPQTASQGSQNFYGKLDSPVTITEYVDFQCEACYAYYPGVKQVKELYKDKVRFQVKNFPITTGHQFAYQAARSAEAAARQGKFWEMHDKIFEGQKVWETTQNPQSIFEGYAESIGLDMTKFKADRDSADVASVINKDLDDVKAIGGNGTPTFAINGKKIDNPGPSVQELSGMIDEALKSNPQ